MPVALAARPCLKEASATLLLLTSSQKVLDDIDARWRDEEGTFAGKAITGRLGALQPGQASGNRERAGG